MSQVKPMSKSQDISSNATDDSDRLLDIVLVALDDMKGVDVRVIDVR